MFLGLIVVWLICSFLLFYRLRQIERNTGNPYNLYNDTGTFIISSVVVLIIVVAVYVIIVFNGG